MRAGVGLNPKVTTLTLGPLPARSTSDNVARGQGADGVADRA